MLFLLFYMYLCIVNGEKDSMFLAAKRAALESNIICGEVMCVVTKFTFLLLNVYFSNYVLYVHILYCKLV